MIVGCVIVAISCACCAMVEQYPVEIKCSPNPIDVPWRVLNGESRFQFTITTEGLRVDGKDSIEEIVDTESVRTKHSGLHAFVVARCIPSNKGADITLTGSFLTCGVGEGIRIKMFSPNSIDPDKYHYVGVLTAVTQDEEKKQETNTSVVNATTRYSEEKSSFYIGLNTPKAEISSSSVVGAGNF